MSYLLAKYTVLFLLTALLSFILGYWWSRRNFVDVSESFDALTKAGQPDQSLWNQLWSRFDAIPAPWEPDFSGVYGRIDKLEAALSALPVPQPVSFASIDSRLDALNKSIEGLPVPKSVSLDPLSARIDKLEATVRSIPVSKETTIDLDPVERRLAAMEQSIRSIPRPDTVDLKPVDSRLSAIEIELRSLRQRLAEPLVAKPVERKEPELLKSAEHGEKDDLKRISGVGPKLERLLNKNGVYYFWQVASWSESDIEIVDARLDVFKGRILRDDWVSQAKSLQLEASSAKQPRR